MRNILVRASGAQGQVRVFVGITTDLVEDARQRHYTSPVASAALGRALTGGALMGMMLKEGQQISLQFLGDGPLGGVFVIADAEGSVRGYVRHPEVELDLNSQGKLDVAKGIGTGTLYVIKDLGLKEPYRGSVPLTSGEVGEDLTYYFTKSEQTPSAVGLGVLVDTDFSVKAAGGFILQLLPDAKEEVIQRLESNLEVFSGGVTGLITEGKSVQDLIALLLDGIEYQITEEREVHFRCKCNREKLEQIVISLGEQEAREILETEKQLELTCHFCNEKYQFTSEDLHHLFRQAKKEE